PQELVPTGNANCAFIFRRMPHWGEYFTELHSFRRFLRQRLLDSIRPDILQSVNQLPAPLISVHVRRGDFRHLGEGEEFAKVGGVRTPTDYFSGIIRNLR